MMNRIKKELEKELQTITLSEKKKQSILRKVHQKKRANWSYRFVLTAFTFLSIGFGYLLITGNNQNLNHTAKPEGRVGESLLSPELFKILLMTGSFGLLYLVLKMILRKRMLPACTKCGEKWSFWQSVKASMKGKEVRCPYCQAEQVKTDKATWEMNLLNLLIPLGIAFSQLFDRVFTGYLLYTVCALLIMVLLSPYLLSFEGNDNVSKELTKTEKRLKVIQIIAPIVIVVIVCWSFWESESSHPTPQEAVAEMFSDTTLIPAYSLNKQDLYFSIMDRKLFSAYYVKKGIFGWKGKNAVTTHQIDYRNITENNYGESFNGTYLVYGLIEDGEGLVVQVGGEEARLLNLETLPAEEVEKLQLEGLSIWYFESDERIDVGETEVKLVDKKTGEVLEELRFE